LYSFDASAIVDLWDDYPIDNPVFKPLWEKFSNNIDNRKFTISDIALKQAKDKIDSDIFNKLVQNIMVYQLETIDLNQSLFIKNLLNITIDGEYFGKGVDLKDIYIIAIAKRTRTILVNTESKQNTLPQIKANYKMPTVCNLSEIQVNNINLTELLNIKDLWQ
jgi:hypothetical protein